jgi:drug/metabolite transporter (DMT)-like permease
VPDKLGFIAPSVTLPLLAAFLFALSSVVIKAASNRGVDIWRTCFITNIVVFIAFSPFVLFAKTWPSWAYIWQPAIVALLFVVGQVFTLISVTKGEISVAAPVLGLKIIFVPIFLWVLHIESPHHTLWLASALATIGIVLLNYNDRAGTGSRVVFSVLCAGAGAASYALFDVCVQQFADNWDRSAFLPIMLFMCMIGSVAFLPLFEQPLHAIPRDARIPLLIGSILFAMQSLGIVCAIAFWGHAAAANVLYSTRGLWGLILVWLLGKRLHASDSGLTKRTFFARMAGTLCLLAAVFVAAF